jgi:3-oxoacyl-[acyl-carrier protein] reductase
MEMSPEMFQKVIDVNLTGAFHCTQVIGKHMIERAKNGDAGGAVVFITSLADRFISASQVEYAASKSGLRMLMCGFATALGPHSVTCNAVAPGMISTEMTGYYWDSPDGLEKIKTLAPIGRGGTPEDIGNAVVFLASPEASYISGETITVDGGFTVLIKH